MILDKIVASTRVRVEAAKENRSASDILRGLDNAALTRGRFKDGLLSIEDVSVIAEIKKASPSKGLIRADFNHMEIAEEYSKCGIQAMSVLTEPEYFKGDLSFVSDIRAKYDIPVLRKDFIVDEYQIYEAKLAGADAILLIMAALSDTEYRDFHRTANELELDVLVETHNAEEVKRAVEYGNIIGVNNRNLQTFEEDITTCERLLPLIPDGKVKVAESAVRTHADFEYLRGLHFDAALIGEAFMRERDIKAAVDRLRYGN
ncbi:MAG: indole-3-glycerol phosphate synthase TrpC [Oscillospiraceae bacterium]|nr:indole-3-glycerol phosphate synthase TrpC [Oscillospiraceae bacterium]